MLGRAAWASRGPAWREGLGGAWGWGRGGQGAGGHCVSVAL